MMKFPALVLVTGLFTVGIGTTFSVAAPNPSAPLLVAQNQTNKMYLGNRFGGPDGMMKQLNLSEEQKQKIESIRQKYQEQTKSLQEQLRKQMEELRVMMDGTASAESIRAKHNQVMTLRQQLGNLRFEGMLESRDVLTLEQRKQFSQLMQQRRAQIKGRRGGNGSPQMMEQPSF